MLATILSSRSREPRKAAIDASTSSATCSIRAAHSTISVPDAVRVVPRAPRLSSATPTWRSMVVSRSDADC